MSYVKVEDPTAYYLSIPIDCQHVNVFVTLDVSEAFRLPLSKCLHQAPIFCQGDFFFFVLEDHHIFH